MQTRRGGAQSIYTTLISGVNIPHNQGYRPKLSAVVVDVIKNEARPETPLGTLKTQLIQTVLRDSEAQTHPFEPDVKTPFDKGLEVLTLGWLSWNNGLPAGMREAVIIERARQRRAWEKAIPLPFNSDTRKIRYMILEAIELNEWAFREAELSVINSIRMELAEKCMKGSLCESRAKYEDRLKRYIWSKTEEKDVAISRERVKMRRSLRKLLYERDHVSKKYQRWDIVRELSDKTSEYYGPQMRFGVDPRRRHEVIPDEFRYWAVFSNADILKYRFTFYDSLEKAPPFNYENLSKPTKKYKQLCMRETKWTDRHLYNMYTLLRALRRDRRRGAEKPCKLKVAIQQPSVVMKTPGVSGVPEEEDTLYEACLFLQKTLKGRAIQTVMFEGRVKCQELLEELKSTHALQSHIADIKAKSRHRVYQNQRKADIAQFENNRRKEIIQSLEGQTVSQILDMLSKELLRLENERETHAAALMADRERHVREAEEAGRRQAEEERYREHEEMWKQIAKVYQNTLDIVMEDLCSGIRATYAAKYGRMKAEEYARKIDLAAAEATQRKDELEEYEITADLVHNFALPETEKEIVRKRLQHRQRTLLSACHDEIYSQLENLDSFNRTPSGRLEPIRRPAKHKIPPIYHVKLLKLKREGAYTTPSNTSVTSTAFQGGGDQWQNDQDPGNAPGSPAETKEDDNKWSTGFSRQEVVMN